MSTLATDRLTLIRHPDAEGWSENVAKEMAGLLAEEIRQRDAHLLRNLRAAGFLRGGIGGLKPRRIAVGELSSCAL